MNTTDRILGEMLDASGLITGVGYLLDVPQDAALPVDQTVVVEAAWRY